MKGLTAHKVPTDIRGIVDPKGEIRSESKDLERERKIRTPREERLEFKGGVTTFGEEI